MDTNTTDELIQASLLELMLEKSLEEITIMAIADRCHLNRTTVYRHFADKYAILEAIEHSVLIELDSSSSEVYQVESQALVRESQTLKVLTLVHEKRKIISILLGPNGDIRFYEYFINFLTTKGLILIDDSPCFNSLDTRQKELLVQYLSSALLGLVKYWLCHPDMSVKELHDFFEALFKNGINSLIEK